MQVTVKIISSLNKGLHDSYLCLFVIRLIAYLISTYKYYKH
jgi:hypothetical protein